MPIAHLIHPVPVVIEQINRSATLYDHDAREEVQVVARTVAIEVSGQVKWTADMALATHKEGASEDESGYVLFSLVELDAIGVSIVRGDKITSIGGQDCAVYIERTEPCGHYSDMGGATLLKAYFASRST